MLSSVEERAWLAYPTGLPDLGHPRLHHIMSAVSLHTGVSIDDIKSERRPKEIIFARKLYCYLARTLTPYSYPKIAMSIYRDHTTVVHAVQSAEEILREGTDEDFIGAVRACKALAIHFGGGHE